MRSSQDPAQPGDLREVSYQLLALSNLLENTKSEETYRFDSRRLSWGLGKILEELALDVDGIADNWERWSLRKHRGSYGRR